MSFPWAGASVMAGFSRAVGPSNVFLSALLALCSCSTGDRLSVLCIGDKSIEEGLTDAGDDVAGVLVCCWLYLTLGLTGELDLLVSPIYQLTYSGCHMPKRVMMFVYALELNSASILCSSHFI